MKGSINNRVLKLNLNNMNFNLNIDNFSKEKNYNFLFTITIFSSLFIFIASNLLLFDYDTFISSFKIYYNCFIILLIFYATTKLFKNIIFGIILTYLLLYGIVVFNVKLLQYLFYFLGLVSFLFFLKSIKYEKKLLFCIFFTCLIYVIYVEKISEIF